MIKNIIFIIKNLPVRPQKLNIIKTVGSTCVILLQDPNFPCLLGRSHRSVWNKSDVSFLLNLSLRCSCPTLTPSQTINKRHLDTHRDLPLVTAFTRFHLFFIFSPSVFHCYTPLTHSGVGDSFMQFHFCISSFCFVPSRFDYVVFLMVCDLIRCFFLIWRGDKL